MAEAAPTPVIKQFGFADELNPRFRRTMEDAHCFHDNIGPEKNIAICAIYDGHGGRETVDFVSMNFHKIFSRLLFKHPDKNLSEILPLAFAATDDQLKQSNILEDGTTAAVVAVKRTIVEGEESVEIVSANCGDARAVLVHDWETERISQDHKPTQESEIERIKNADCFVIRGRVAGVLAVSRALGDHGLKQAVISDPYVSRRVMNKQGVTHVIVACDGVWDVIEDQEAGEIVMEHRDDCQAAASKLLAIAKDKQSMDNISVMVVRVSDSIEPFEQRPSAQNETEDDFQETGEVDPSIDDIPDIQGSQIDQPASESTTEQTEMLKDVSSPQQSTVNNQIPQTSTDPDMEQQQSADSVSANQLQATTADTQEAMVKDEDTNAQA